MSDAVRLILVRHGQAAAGWDADLDPGLSETGRHQAETATEALRRLGPWPILTSPLRRARETAAPLERNWATTATVDPGIGEIVSPTDDLAERTAWLGQVMAGTWGDAGPELHGWRERVLDTLRGQREDTVLFSHFIAINVAVGAATDDQRVVSFFPDNGSRTTIEVRDGRLTVIELGDQARTAVR